MILHSQAILYTGMGTTGGNFSRYCKQFTHNLYVSSRMKSNTWDTPTWNWSAIGGTHGLFSALNTCFVPTRSSAPVNEINDVGHSCAKLGWGKPGEGAVYGWSKKVESYLLYFFLFYFKMLFIYYLIFYHSFYFIYIDILF